MLSMGERVFGSDGRTPARAISGDIIPQDSARFRGTVRWIRTDHMLVELLMADPHEFRHDAVDDGRAPSTPVVGIAVLGDGRIEAVGERGPMHLERGDAVVLDTGRAFSYRADAAVRLLLVLLDADRVPQHIRDAPPLPAGPLTRTRLVNSYIAFVSALLPAGAGAGDAEEPDDRLGKALEDLHIGVLAEAHGGVLPEPGSDGLRYRIAEYVDANLGDPALSPGSIAAELGISLRYAHQVFNRDDLTLARFVRERRLAAVAGLLRDPHMPVRTSELATRFGFGSRDQLTRAFRRRYGMTMREYRDAGTKRPA